MSEEQASYGEKEFKNLLEVSEWLDQQGWKVSRSTLYKHAKDGRLRPDEHGAFPAKAVEKYAIQWLHKKSDSEKVKTEKLAEIERKERIGYQSALRRQMELKLAALEGKYIEREQLYLELAARAAVLDTGIKALVRLRADAWLAVAHGRQSRMVEFMRTILADMEELINAFSSTREFHVMFKNEDRPPTADGREEKEEE